MEYTSNQLAAIFLVARFTRRLKNGKPIGTYLENLSEIKAKVRAYNKKHPWDRTYMWYDPGFVVETRSDFARAMDSLNYEIDAMDDHTGYDSYDLY